MPHLILGRTGLQKSQTEVSPIALWGNYRNVIFCYNQATAKAHLLRRGKDKAFQTGVVDPLYIRQVILLEGRG